MRTRVLAVGGGPVGLTLAMDLAWRGIDVIVAERHGHRALPRTYSRAWRAWHPCRSWAGHYLADARAYASLQSEVFRAGAVRARYGAAAHPHPASHRDHRPGPERRGCDRERRRPRWRHTFKD